MITNTDTNAIEHAANQTMSVASWKTHTHWFNCHFWLGDRKGILPVTWSTKLLQANSASYPRWDGKWVTAKLL